MRSPTNHRWSFSASKILSGLALALLFSGLATAQTPRPLGQRVPAKDLAVYIEFDGFDAHAKEWKASSAYKALNQTTLGVLLEDLAAQGLDLAMKGKVVNPPKGTEVLSTIELVLRKGFVLAYNVKPPEQPRTTVVIRGGMAPAILGLIQRFDSPEEKAASRTIQKGSRKVTITKEGPTSAVLIDDKGDLVVTDFSFLDQTLALLDGKEANAATNPTVIELAKADGAFKPIATAFFDFSMIAPKTPQLAALGLDGLKRVDYRWGVRDVALYSVFRLVAPSPRRGVLALFDGPTFDKSTMPVMPAGVTDFAVASMSPSQLYDKVLAIARQVVPNGDQQITMMQGQVNQMLGVKLREDLLAKLGPKWTMYSAPADALGGLPFNVVAMTEITDSAKLVGTLGQVIQVANAKLQQMGGPPNAPKTPAPQFQKLAGPQMGFELVIPPGMIPPGTPAAALKPTILIGKKFLAISATSTAAASGLAVAEASSPRWKADAVYATVLDNLPSGLVMMTVSDPRQSLPQMLSQLPLLMGMGNMMMAGQAPPGGGPAIPITIDPAKIPKPADLSANLFPAFMAVSVDAKGISVTTRESLPSVGSPAVAGVAVALLLPAVQAAREAARRTQCVNNLKQIGLGLHNFHSANNNFPGNIVSKQGKPLLSWRVAILPYIDQNTLYNKFKLDEPWDSPNNKELLKFMPPIYACPSKSSTEPGMTPYQGFVGPKAFFADPNKPASVRTITDGTSNTIAVVEANSSVAWTKPDDLPFAPNSTVKLFGAGSVHPGVFNVLIADGAVRAIKTNINPELLKALITTNGGEAVAPGAF